MKILPFYSSSFTTGLDKAEAVKRLHDEIGPPKWWVMIGPFNAHVGLNADRRLFLGQKRGDGGVFGNNLNTEPGALSRYNSFQAVVRVRITPSARGSTVHASFRLPALVLAFLGAWSAPFIWFTIAMAGSMMRDGQAWAILVGPAFVAAAWFFAGFAFSEDAASAERMLKVTLER
jgi:hypothetical protein